MEKPTRRTSRKTRSSPKAYPADANTWLMTLTDERGAMVTSAVGLR